MAETPSKLDLYSGLARVFTPHAPVNDRDLFRGLLDQIFAVSAAINQNGLHVMLYGERGVGKTSMANLFDPVTQV